MADDDPSMGSPPSVSPPPNVSGGVAAGGGDTQGGAGPQTGNLPPTGAPSARPVAKLGLEARGAEVARGALQALTIALPMVGGSSKLGMAILHAIQKLGKELPEQNQGGGQDQLMQALQRAQARGGPQGGTPPPGGGMQPPPQAAPGPPPAMTA